MRTDKIRKYILPNIPYLFIGWACLKVGTAYRLAAGADFANKLIGMVQALGPAFADFAPGFDPFDWLVGILGAVQLRSGSCLLNLRVKEYTTSILIFLYTRPEINSDIQATSQN